MIVKCDNPIEIEFLWKKLKNLNKVVAYSLRNMFILFLCVFSFYLFKLWTEQDLVLHGKDNIYSKKKKTQRIPRQQNFVESSSEWVSTEFISDTVTLSQQYLR